MPSNPPSPASDPIPIAAHPGGQNSPDLPRTVGAGAGGQPLTLSAGAKPIPNYTLLRQLGRGAFGEVWEAAGPGGVLVAMKFIRLADKAADAEKRALKLLQGLRHPNLLALHGVWGEGGYLVVAMELADGTLLDRLTEAVAQGHPGIPRAELLQYMRQAAAALDYLNGQGVQHRDVKPANLLLVGGGVKVADFGLAKFLDKTMATASSAMTPAYAAPELFNERVSRWSDQYSLAVTYCHLRGNRLPFEGNLAALLAGHLMNAPDLQMLPAEEQVLVVRALAKLPQERWPSCTAFVEALATGPASPGLPGRGRNPPSEGVVTVSSGIGANVEEDNGQPADPVEVPRPPERFPTRPVARFRTVWLIAAVMALAAATSAGTWWTLSGGDGIPSSPDRRTARVPESKGAVVPEPKAEVKPSVKPPVPAVQGVSIAVEKDGRRVRTPKYEALVGADGNLTSLRVGGVEFLKSGQKFGDNVSRGGFFYYSHEKPARVVSLPTLEQLGGNVLKATGDRFTIVYEFGPDSLSLKLTNATDYKVPFYLVFDRTVTGVMNERGEVARTPAAKPWPITSWFAGRAKLTITGGNRIWGPWPSPKEGCQVWEATLASFETREVLLTVGTASDAELARVGPPPDSGGAIQIKKLAFEAVVEADGCLTSLSVEGVEFLCSNVDTSRGVYFHDGKALVKLGNVTRPSPGVIAAKGARASVRYEFGPDNVTVNATNATDKALALFIVFDPAVNAVVDGAGEWAKVPLSQKPGPAERKWQTTTWFANGARLKITGDLRVWGSWSAEKLQVWEASLAPKETRRVVLSAGLATDAEAKEVAALTGKPVVRASVVVQSPQDYQVFQRRSRLQGQILLRGHVRPECDRVEVRLIGKPLEGALPPGWQPVPLGKGTRAFDHTLPAPAGGWYKVELRALKGEKPVAEAVVEHVGVGEVFVGAGQSNSTNCGLEKLKQESGMVATFDGRRWRLGDDPQPGVHDHTTGGSYFPAFGDALYAKYHVPVGVASVGHSGTGVKQWEPGGELFGWMMTRIRQLGPGGFRAVQWHQGESDVGMSADEYVRRLTEVIQESNREAGWKFPWMVARVSYHNPQQATFPTTRAAQKRLWDTGVALEGPDTDTLTGDNRDEGGRGIHFSARGLRAHGRMWADRVGAYLDKLLVD